MNAVSPAKRGAPSQHRTVRGFSLDNDDKLGFQNQPLQAESRCAVPTCSQVLMAALNACFLTLPPKLKWELAERARKPDTPRCPAPPCGSSGAPGRLSLATPGLHNRRRITCRNPDPGGKQSRGLWWVEKRPPPPETPTS